MIITNIEGLRDPFVLIEDNTYYVYGTGVRENHNWATHSMPAIKTKADGLTVNGS